MKIIVIPGLRNLKECPRMIIGECLGRYNRKYHDNVLIVW